MTYWIEIRPGLRRSGPPRLVPLEQTDQHRGFRSVVAFDDATAEQIRGAGSTAQMRGVAVYADTLFMDFDGHDPHEFRQWLQQSGLGHTEWDSGGRSVHFHIPLVPVFGDWVCVAMKQWTKQRAPTADTSFLHPSGMYRLPGTYHSKRAGHCKVLIAQQDGALLQLQPPAQYVAAVSTYQTGDPEEFYAALLRPVREGHRRPRAWLLSTLAAEAGLSFDEAYEKLLWWSSRFCDPPHDAETIHRQVTSAYERLARKQA